MENTSFEIYIDHISLKKLKSFLDSFSYLSNLPVELLDKDGNILYKTKKDVTFCSVFRQAVPTQNSCQDTHLDAAKKAFSFGDVYCFSCHSGLYNIAYPLFFKKAPFLSVVAGPFYMDESDVDVLIENTQQYGLPTDICEKMQQSAMEIATISPDFVTQISIILFYGLKGLSIDSQESFKINQDKILQQNRINESIQMYKNSGYSYDKHYPIETENTLITKIKSGDTEGAKSTLNELLGYLFLQYGNDADRIKARIVELSALLSRTTIEQGADISRVLKMNSNLIDEIMKAKDVYTMCFTFQNNLNIFTESIFYSTSKNNKMIRQATEYIATHFSEDILLTDMAEHLHLNSSYLSVLFKQTTGVSFNEYLNKVRINEAKYLLSNTDYSIIDIAYACGFNSQGYFTKVFKRLTGITPKQFR